MSWDNNTKAPQITQLTNPVLMQASLSLDAIGKIAISANDLLYLKVEDAYIHQLFPLLQNKNAQKPDYFGSGSVGAHISIIYPEETTFIPSLHCNEKHSFLVKELVAAELGAKTYYAIAVEAPSLLQLRRKYALPDQLCLKGYLISFHITIGIAE
jgi:hypothetical protein